MPALTLQPGFTSDPGSGTPKYEHTDRGVTLYGTVVGAFDGTGQVVATLSAGSGILGSYRPRAIRRLPVTASGSGVAAPGYVEVGPTGEVTVYATADRVSLDGVVLAMSA